MKKEFTTGVTPTNNNASQLTKFVTDLPGKGTNAYAAQDPMSPKIHFVMGSGTKSYQKLNHQMNARGWTEQSVWDTVVSPYTTRNSTNRATGNPATVYYTKEGSYVIVDDVTKEIVQVSDNIKPSTWAPDQSIVNPYIPE